MSVSIENLLTKIEHDLERPTSNYVLFTRFEAQFLYDEVIALIRQRNELLHEKGRRDDLQRS